VSEIAPSQPGSLGGECYERLREAIVSGQLQPNERLVEADLSERFGASRSAVRTALLRLAHDGLVVHERNRGARVRLVDPAEALEILEARCVLEGLAARHAALRARRRGVLELRRIQRQMRSALDAGDLLLASDLNGELHRRIAAMSEHRTAIRLIEGLNWQIVRYQYRTILVPGRAERSYAEHSAIIDAIAARDGAGAEQAMREHLLQVTAALEEHAHASEALGGLLGRSV
jgi:DNA-binding GntR family transcriptional regulator